MLCAHGNDYARGGPRLWRLTHAFYCEGPRPTPVEERVYRARRAVVVGRYTRVRRARRATIAASFRRKITKK